MKIETIGDLAQSDRLEICWKLGKADDQLWRYANGQDNEPVRSFYAPKELKGVGNGMTFRHDLRSEPEIRQGVMLLADSIAARMRVEAVQCTTVQVQIKDPNFKTIQRQQKLPRPTCLQREIAETAMALIRANWNLGAPIRLITLTGADLVPAGEAHEQIGLFADEGRERHQRLEKLEDAMAKIRGKYGSESIGYGTPKDDI